MDVLLDWGEMGCEGGAAAGRCETVRGRNHIVRNDRAKPSCETSVRSHRALPLAARGRTPSLRAPHAPMPEQQIEPQKLVDVFCPVVLAAGDAPEPGPLGGLN